MEKSELKRAAELRQIITKKGDDNDIKAGQLIEEIVFIEARLAELRGMPFIKVDPKDPTRQKATPASKQYKELLQQYNNSMRLLLRLAGDLGSTEEESPLREWLKGKKENGEIC